MKFIDMLIIINFTVLVCAIAAAAYVSAAITGDAHQQNYNTNDNNNNHIILEPEVVFLV